MNLPVKIKKIAKYFIFAAVVLLLVLLVTLLTKKTSGTKSEQEKPVVIVQKPQIGTLTESITLSGYVEAKAMIPIVPFVQGTITEYNAKAGDFVYKDTVLAKIDDAPFEQQKLQAQAAYLAAQSTFDRIQSLYKSGATSQQNYDSAKAQRDASKAQYDLAQLQYDYTQVKASVDGTILIADMAVGSIASGTEPIAVLADLSDQVVRLTVPEKYFDLFNLQKENLTVTVTRPADASFYEDAVTSATIETIAPYVSPQSKNFTVVCHLDQPGERFRPGMYVKVSVAYSTHTDVPLLPLTTKKIDGSLYSYDEQTQTVHYHLFEDTPSDATHFIVPAEYANFLFVTDGQNSVFDGQEVRVTDGGLFEDF